MLQITANNTACLGSSKRMTKEVAKQLKKFVEQSIYDRETIRSAVGVDRSTMSRHLNGKLSLSYNKIQEYSRALGINVHQLIGISPMQVIGRSWETDDVDRVHLYDIDDDKVLIYPTIGYESDIVCITKCTDSYRPWLSKSVICFSDKNIKNKSVPEDTQEAYCFIKYKSENGAKYKLAIPYKNVPIPGEKPTYSLVSPSKPGVMLKEDQAVEIIYACPILDWVLKAKTVDWRVTVDGKGEIL